MSAQGSVIHWFRRDLRIVDNPSLLAAAACGRPVVPVYILSDWQKRHAWTGANRQKFLCGCLASLAANLRTLSGSLILRQGDAVSRLAELARQTGAAAIHFNLDPDPFGKQVEARLREQCAAAGIECHGHHDTTLHGPDEVLTQSGQPYRVFTPYHRNWSALEKPAARGKPPFLRTPAGIDSLALPDVGFWGLDEPAASLPEPGERAAAKRLSAAIEGNIRRYAADRDLPAREGTSRISQDLRFGLVSIRKVFAKLMAARLESSPPQREAIDVFIKELAWREFYFAALHHYPHVLRHEFNEDWRGMPWRGPGEALEAWKHGRTGFPIVDAGMRQLLATGFMHNRLRMITAMFLTKDLHIDWKLGESWFMRHLVDGEIASNNGGWQWSAGTGADAAPYFRIQNPWTQTSAYDPDGVYIRRWVPELRHTDPALFMAPPKNGAAIAPGYPAPIVDHKAERARTLAIFARHRDSRR